LRKGIENMRKFYGKFGYIDFVPEPSFDVVSQQRSGGSHADGGRKASSFSSGASISGNTTTRDKVIRREILLDEGDIFNSELWDYSILPAQPARLFRNAEEGRRRRHQAQSAVQHGGT